MSNHILTHLVHRPTHGEQPRKGNYFCPQHRVMMMMITETMSIMDLGLGLNTVAQHPLWADTLTPNPTSNLFWGKMVVFKNNKTRLFFERPLLIKPSILFSSLPATWMGIHWIFFFQWPVTRPLNNYWMSTCDILHHIQSYKTSETAVIIPKVQMRNLRLQEAKCAERQGKVQAQGVNTADQSPKPVLLTATKYSSWHGGRGEAGKEGDQVLPSEWYGGGKSLIFCLILSNPPGSLAKGTVALRILQWFPIVHREIHVLHIRGFPKSGPILPSWYMLGLQKNYFCPVEVQGQPQVFRPWCL